MENTITNTYNSVNQNSYITVETHFLFLIFFFFHVTDGSIPQSHIVILISLLLFVFLGCEVLPRSKNIPESEIRLPQKQRQC